MTNLTPVATSLLCLQLSLLDSERFNTRGVGVNLLWIRPIVAEGGFEPDERRVRDYVDAPGGVSESAASLADKLGMSRRRCRRILEGLVDKGVLKRHEFADIQPVYTRFPSR